MDFEKKTKRSRSFCHPLPFLLLSLSHHGSMSMLRNITGRRYVENDATKQPEGKGPAAINTKRRALGKMSLWHRTNLILTSP